MNTAIYLSFGTQWSDIFLLTIPVFKTLIKKSFFCVLPCAPMQRKRLDGRVRWKSRIMTAITKCLAFQKKKKEKKDMVYKRCHNAEVYEV
jgi:hypothetical protein